MLTPTIQSTCDFSQSSYLIVRSSTNLLRWVSSSFVTPDAVFQAEEKRPGLRYWAVYSGARISPFAPVLHTDSLCYNLRSSALSSACRHTWRCWQTADLQSTLLQEPTKLTYSTQHNSIPDLPLCLRCAAHVFFLCYRGNRFWLHSTKKDGHGNHLFHSAQRLTTLLSDRIQHLKLRAQKEALHPFHSIHLHRNSGHPDCTPEPRWVRVRILGEIGGVDYGGEIRVGCVHPRVIDLLAGSACSVDAAQSGCQVALP